MLRRIISPIIRSIRAISEGFGLGIGKAMLGSPEIIRTASLPNMLVNATSTAANVWIGARVCRRFVVCGGTKQPVYFLICQGCTLVCSVIGVTNGMFALAFSKDDLTKYTEYAVYCLAIGGCLGGEGGIFMNPLLCVAPPGDTTAPYVKSELKKVKSLDLIRIIIFPISRLSRYGLPFEQLNFYKTK